MVAGSLVEFMWWSLAGIGRSRSRASSEKMLVVARAATPAHGCHFGTPIVPVESANQRH